MKKLLILLLFFITILRLYPILTNEFCFADDCLYYYNSILGKWHKASPEPLFVLITTGMYLSGINEVLIMRIFMISLPLLFSFGLYFLLKDRLKTFSLYAIIIASNILLGMNLFWFVLIKNGLMLVFFPFFLYYYIEKKYGKSLVFFILMTLSHLTFVFLTLPIFLHSLFKRKNIPFSSFLLLLMVMFGLYYLLSPQIEVIAVQRMTNLNYLFVDIPFLLFAIISLFKKKLDLYNTIFIVNVILTLASFFFLAEGWRMFILLNIPILLSAIIFIDKQNNKILNYILIIYLIGMSVLFSAYIITLKSQTIKVGGEYVFIDQ